MFLLNAYTLHIPVCYSILLLILVPAGMGISRPFSDWLVQHLHHLKVAHCQMRVRSCLLNTPVVTFLSLNY